MNNLIIERTQETPEIHFDCDSGVLRISGRAYSSNISLFYKQMKEWLDEYLKSPQEITIVDLQLDYYNSVFIKLMFYFLEKCKEVVEKDKKLVIKWRCQEDDDESIDDASRISKIVNLPFEIVTFD